MSGNRCAIYFVISADNVRKVGKRTESERIFVITVLSLMLLMVVTYNIVSICELDETPDGS